MNSATIDKIPFTIISGFLGSGKTTFLSRFLKLSQMKNAFVIINEYGEFSLDHLLIEEFGKQADEQVFQLPNGCLCCGARGQLIEKMLELSKQKISGALKFDHLIIETSGVTDTQNLMLNMWQQSDIRKTFRLSKIITLISALEWMQNFDNFEESESQLAISDLVLISKIDLLTANSRKNALGHMSARIGVINPTAQIFQLPATSKQLSFIAEGEENTIRPASNSNDHHGHAPTYKTFTLQTRYPISISEIEFFMDALLNKYGDTLLRVKGLVNTSQNPECPLVIQSVKSILSPLTWLKRWPSIPATKITIIHTGENELQIRNLFSSVLNIPSIDQPDKAALSQNPLSITGMGEFKAE